MIGKKLGVCGGLGNVDIARAVAVGIERRKSLSLTLPGWCNYIPLEEEEGLGWVNRVNILHPSGKDASITH